MKSKELISLLQIINLAAVHGTPLVLDIISNWNSEEEITSAMIAKLRADLKPAADLFPELDTE